MALHWSIHLFDTLPLYGLLYKTSVCSTRGNSTTMITITSCPVFMVLLNVLGAHGSTRAYRRMVYENECKLLRECKSQKIAVRSQIECFLLTTANLGTGAYYSPSCKICNMCLPTSPSTYFTAFTSDMDYHAGGKYRDNAILFSFFIHCGGI